MSPARLSRRRFLAIAGVGVAAVPASRYAAYANALQAQRSSIPDPPPPAVPHREPLRIALATDAHAPHFWFETGELAALVRAFDPHLLFISGDAVDRRGEEHRVRMYESVPARLGRFAALGNWEHQGRCDLALLGREYERAGVRLLVNQRVTVDFEGETLDIVGLDDWRAGAPDYQMLAERAAPWIDPTDTNKLTPFDHAAFALRVPPVPRTLVLSHCPVSFDVISALRRTPMTMFAGHTHGGQVAPFGVALYRPVGSGRYLQGWYGHPDSGHRMYVSRGLGNSGIPFRMGSRPEIALLTL